MPRTPVTSSLPIRRFSIQGIASILLFSIALGVGMIACDRSTDAGTDATPTTAATSHPSTTSTTRSAKPIVDDDNLVAKHTTQPSTQPIVFDDSKWVQLFRGIEHRHIILSSPRMMHVHVIRIDMRTPGLRFMVTPPDPKTGMWSSLTTSHFVQKYKAKIGINGSAFSPVFDVEGQAQKAYGMIICDGEIKSKYTQGVAALMITDDNHARVVSGQTKPDVTGVKEYLSGFSMVLSNAEVVNEKSTALHPRTAAGVTADGNTLFLVVVDGRQPFYSQGATGHDLGEIFKTLGATDAVNLDGGGSTAMIMLNDKDEPIQLNSPINKGIPGNERPDATHLGVFVDIPK